MLHDRFNGSLLLSTGFLLLASISLRPAAAQQIEGINLEYAQLPAQVTASFPVDLNAQSFNTRLKEGGTWSFSHQDVTLGKPDPTSNTVHFLALDTLELKDGARIITNGNTLVIFVNTLNIGDGKIVSFVEDKAASGAAASAVGQSGGRGARGDDGGIVSIHVVQKINGLLDVDLHGQAGGDGGAGAIGATGAPGRNGADGVSSVYDCRRGGENGGDGGQGGRGGDGGPGGDGGSGGTLLLFNIGNRPIPAAAYKFAAPPGGLGTGGARGDQGLGGPGGRRGGGSGFCGGGERDGNTGPRGPFGEPGKNGSQGAAGSAVVKALKLVTTIERVKTGATAEAPK